MSFGVGKHQKCLDVRQVSDEFILLDNSNKKRPRNDKGLEDSQSSSALTSSSDTEMSSRDDEAIFEVSDNGPGIDAKHIPHLTERFYRADSHRSRALGGTGLGLAIVKHILNRHRGRLQISSIPGEGSTFTVLLPRAQEAR